MASNTDITTRVLVVALKSPYIAKTTAEIMTITNLSTHKINHIYAHSLPPNEPNSLNQRIKIPLINSYCLH
ncbi:hypothetical protein I7I53_05832 [Histoplasma capsulatum var. duboisii H88]|uniref:Uncharacterized protein n=1 Tax=Ajellomyces capsulatus (strain H88) TaxID=544711 RepID=A0A8A1LTF5_AJEC8|nr:hypothetical protein I7I53_05832 [Histoplasma capsulatum var. duboisii H88]